MFKCAYCGNANTELRQHYMLTANKYSEFEVICESCFEEQKVEELKKLQKLQFNDGYTIEELRKHQGFDNNKAITVMNIFAKH